MVNDEFKENGIEFEGRGYFGCPDPPADVTLDDLQADAWLHWITILYSAKQGNFEPMTQLIDLYKQAETPMFEDVCRTLLGDAGTAAIMAEVIQELETTDSLELTLDFSDALRFRGQLSDVPVLLRAYEKIARFEDAEIIPIYLSELLEFHPGALGNPANFSSLGEYREAIMNRYAERTDKFGTDSVLILGGERFSVIRLAERILRELTKTYFPVDLRRKFEASTGIDCTGFYREEAIQPDEATRIVEAFLQSHDSERYEDGVRYFFGHRIPD